MVLLCCCVFAAPGWIGEGVNTERNCDIAMSEGATVHDVDREERFQSTMPTALARLCQICNWQSLAKGPNKPKLEMGPYQQLTPVALPIGGSCLIFMQSYDLVLISSKVVILYWFWNKKKYPLLAASYVAVLCWLLHTTLHYAMFKLSHLQENGTVAYGIDGCFCFHLLHIWNKWWERITFCFEVCCKIMKAKTWSAYALSQFMWDMEMNYAYFFSSAIQHKLFFTGWLPRRPDSLFFFPIQRSPDGN